MYILCFFNYMQYKVSPFGLPKGSLGLPLVVVRGQGFCYTTPSTGKKVGSVRSGTFWPSQKFLFRGTSRIFHFQEAPEDEGCPRAQKRKIQDVFQLPTFCTWKKRGKGRKIDVSDLSEALLWSPRPPRSTLGPRGTLEIAPNR